jgi:YD repeat-containing protein
MKKLILLGIIFSATVYGQTSGSGSDGPVFDRDGRLVCYQYPDGKTESYAYDSQWRMKSFKSREEKVMTFIYASDGSMQTVNPDGSIKNSPTHQ